MAGKIKALPYQKEGVWDIEDMEGRALLADDMGLGKTMQALWFIKRQRLPTQPAVVVCPAGVKYNWEAEARQLGLSAQVLEGQTPPRGVGFGGKPQLWIINYDIIPYWVDWFKKMGVKALILDECQNIKNPKTNRTKAVKKLSTVVECVVGLSGTPLMNKPAELWPTLNVIRPDLYPSFMTYAVEYCQPTRAPWGWEYKGATNLDKLHVRLRRHVMIRRLKSEVQGQLPKKVRKIVPVGLRDPDQYELARTDFRKWLEKHKKGKVVKATRAEALTQLGYLIRLAAKLKLRNVCNWINHYLEETNEKLVVFAVHRKMIKALRRRTECKSVVIDGSVTGRKRKQAIDQFVHDPDTRVVIGNIQAMGTGTNGLQHAASTMAFAEMCWRPADLTQGEDRLHRIGQEDRTWIYFLVAYNTIEEKLCKIVQKKQTVLRAALDGGKSPENDLDILDQLMEVLKEDL